MPKRMHEFRDPLYGFVRLDSEERKVLDSHPLQRLRDVHQLALSYLVYPGATHRRFEHSLGVCHLATRIFEVLTDPENIGHAEIRGLIPGGDQLQYWRRVLRMAALCHDVGHLPFSHAAEHALLPDGWDHERLGIEIIRSPEMREIWKGVKPPLDADDIVKVAVGPRKLKEVTFSAWEALLAEIVVGDAFGADRMDYLLRDAYHAGVPYGHVDHHRLIDTLRLLPARHQDSEEPTIGVEEGGLESVEALLLARYFMYRQVYMHPVRRIYDWHLAQFLAQWLPGGRFATDIERHLSMSDSEVLAALMKAARTVGAAGQDAADRVLSRHHFKLVYQRALPHIRRRSDAARAVYEGLRDAIGEPHVYYDRYRPKGSPETFPVLLRATSEIVSSTAISTIIGSVPPIAIDYVFVNPDKRTDAEAWLKANLERILAAPPKEED